MTDLEKENIRLDEKNRALEREAYRLQAVLMILRAKIDATNKEMEVAEQKKNIPPPATKQARVLAFIQMHPEGVTRAEIRKAFEDVTEGYLNILLFNLRKTGKIRNTQYRRAHENGRAYGVYLAI